MSDARHHFDDLVALLHRLRSPGGCPWDAEQTHETLRPYLVEETYEVLEAIEGGDDAELRDELGDLLLQVVFHSELAAERGAFTIRDVTEAISAKLIRRHPHVFADVEVGSSAEVERNWAAIKKAERKERDGGDSSAIDGIPRAMPALTRAHRTGEKAASVGFDWSEASEVRRKVTEELAEADAAAAGGDAAALEEEIGDLLFAVASWARQCGLHAEQALDRALAKFSTRFRTLESGMRLQGREMSACSPEELESAWQAAKAALKTD
ncbi:MAG: nucleoside triphosphate pyrophosphohydrolase [Candidatus Binatia bacterium]